MKKIMPVLMALMTLFILSSCKKEKKVESKPAEPVTVVDTVVPETIKPVEKLVEKKSVFIYKSESQGASLYRENEDEKMIWVSEAEDGDKVTIMYKESGEPYIKSAVRVSNGNETEMEFIKVIYDEEEYWSRGIFVASADTIPAFISVENTYIYKKPDIIEMTSSTIPFGTFVALDDSYKDADFVKVVYFDGSTDFGKECYLKKNEVCKDENAILTYKTTRNLVKMEKEAEKNNKTIEKVVFEEVTSIINNFDFGDFDEALINYFSENYNDLYSKIYN